MLWFCNSCWGWLSLFRGDVEGYGGGGGEDQGHGGKHPMNWCNSCDIRVVDPIFCFLLAMRIVIAYFLV